MNQLFYNMPGGIVQQIRREKWTTISEVSVVSEILSKIGIGLISNLLSKGGVFYLTISKLKILSLP